jgi:ABC-type multidrug transport system fused ATPase/permease subunit
LSFAVAGGIQLLKQVNLDLKPGEQLALVGFSGSGKSTLAQCIGQLYSYTGGSVLIDGKEVSQLTKKDLAENMGIVAQSPYIFDGTIKENLRYSCEALLEDEDARKQDKLPTLDEMIEVVQQVGLFVDVLRFGLNTILAVNPIARPTMVSRTAASMKSSDSSYTGVWAMFMYTAQLRMMDKAPLEVLGRLLCENPGTTVMKAVTLARINKKL